MKLITSAVLGLAMIAGASGFAFAAQDDKAVTPDATKTTTSTTKVKKHHKAKHSVKTDQTAAPAAVAPAPSK